MNQSVAPAVSFTERALAHIQKQIATQALAPVLRLSVKPTGCSGWSYVVEFVDAPQAQDIIFQIEDGILGSIDKESYPLVKGMSVDYVRIGMSERFEFKNPNAKNLCGCGESFHV